MLVLAAGCAAWDHSAEQTVPDATRVEMYDTCVRDYQGDAAALRERCEPLLRPIKRRPATSPTSP